jgi:uridine phosphorylase
MTLYREAAEADELRSLGVLGVEMETSVILTVAALRGLRAGSVCLVLDRVADRSTWARPEDEAAGIHDLIELGLMAAARLDRKSPRSPTRAGPLRTS